MKKQLLIILLLLSSLTILNAQNLRIEADEFLKNQNNYKIIDVRDKKRFP